MLHKTKIYIVTVAIISAILMLGSCTKDIITIESIQIASIDNDTIYSGKEYQLKVLTNPSSDDTPRLSWSVSDPTIATVQYGGVLKPLKGGDITVYVNSLQSGGKKVSDSRKFVVLNSGVFLKDKAVTINPLEVKKLEYEFLPKDFKPSGEITWISENPEIASVDQEGNVKGIQDGETIVKVRMGNPLSGFYSESSCMVTVKSFSEPTYTYQQGILDFEQEVPGLLPMTARKIEYFKKIIVKGPINGTDILFFIENSQKIEFLDLGQTYVVKGGRKLKAIPYNQYNKEETYSIDNNNVVPYMYWTKLKIKNLVVPQKLVSPFSFGRPKNLFSFGDTDSEFPMDYLEFPDTYEEIELINGNVKKVKFSKNLKRLICNTYMLDMEHEPYTEFTFKDKVELPESLQVLKATNAVFESELIIPSNVKELNLMSKHTDLIFEPNNKVQIKPNFIPEMRHRNSTEGFLKVDKIVFPEGLKTIGYKAFGRFFPGQAKRQEFGNTLKHIIFPSTLKKIEHSVFYYAEIEKPIELPVGIEVVEYSAFQASSISEVFIPASITKIGNYAFADCPKLEKVHIAIANPSVIKKDAFKRDKKLGKIHKLFVPKGAKQTYIDAGYQNYFFEIIEE